MKIRKGFVTNSSSSSFICEVCSSVEAGYDLSLSEAHMVECENGHTFCENHIIEDDDELKDVFIEKNKKLVNKRLEVDEVSQYLKENNLTVDELFSKDINEITNIFEKIFKWDAADDLDYLNSMEYIKYGFYDRYNVTSTMCPLCTHEYVTDSQMVEYALIELNISQKDLETLTRKYLISKDVLKSLS